MRARATPETSRTALLAAPGREIDVKLTNCRALLAFALRRSSVEIAGVELGGRRLGVIGAWAAALLATLVVGLVPARARRFGCRRRLVERSRSISPRRRVGRRDEPDVPGCGFVMRRKGMRREVMR